MLVHTARQGAIYLRYCCRHFKTWTAVVLTLTLLSGLGQRTLPWEPERKAMSTGPGRLQSKPISGAIQFQMSAHCLGNLSGGASSDLLLPEPWHVLQSV